MFIEENISASSASEIKKQPVEGLTLVKKEEVYDEEPIEWFTMVNYDIIPTAPEEIDYNPEYSGSAPTTKDVKDEPQQIEELEHEEIDIKDEPLENASKKVERKRGKAKTDEQVFQCHNCGFKTTNKATLKSHVKFHSRKKPFACNICSYKTVDKSNLSSHMKIHTGEKPHQCSHCGYKTTSKYYLMQHETIHVGTKLFKCDICGHETRYKNCLSRHMRRHTGEKSPERIYLCDHCDYHCKSRKQLNRHKLKHTDEKPFECSECEFRTKLKHSLTRHIKRKHLCQIIGIDHVDKRVIVKNAMQRVYNLHPHDLPEDFNTSAYYTNSEKYLAEIKQLRKLLPRPYQSENGERSFTEDHYSIRIAQSVVEVAPTVNTVQRNEFPAYASHNNNRSWNQQSVNSASGPGSNVVQVATAPYSNSGQRNEPLSYASYNNERLIQQSPTVNGRNVGKVVIPYCHNTQYPHLQRNEPPPYPLYNNKRLIQQPSSNGRNERIATAPYLKNAQYPPVLVQRNTPPAPPYRSQNTKQKFIPQVTTVNSANGHGNVGQVTTMAYANNAHYPPVQKNALQQLSVMYASYNYNGNSVIQQTNSVQGSGFVPCASYTKGWYKCMCRNVRHNF